MKKYTKLIIAAALLAGCNEAEFSESMEIIGSQNHAPAHYEDLCNENKNSVACELYGDWLVRGKIEGSQAYYSKACSYGNKGACGKVTKERREYERSQDDISKKWNFTGYGTVIKGELEELRLSPDHVKSQCRDYHTYDYAASINPYSLIGDCVYTAVQVDQVIGNHMSFGRLKRNGQYVILRTYSKKSEGISDGVIYVGFFKVKGVEKIQLTSGASQVAMLFDEFR